MHNFKHPYIFILGREPLLSMAELVSFLKKEQYEFKLLYYDKEVCILDFSTEIDAKKVIANLGSSLKVGAYVGDLTLNAALGNVTLMKNILNGYNFYEWIDEKMHWGISVYGDYPNKHINLIYNLKAYFEDRLKFDGARRAMYSWPRSLHHFQRKAQKVIQLMPDDIIRKRLIDKGIELMVFVKSDKCYLWKTVGVLDLRSFDKRDFGRPNQRPMYSISPALARTMINLSLIKKGDVLLDPFCGIGTILQEALIMGIDIRGIDSNNDCISAATNNIKWLVTEYNLELNDTYKKIFLGDATKLNEHFNSESIDAVVTEPPLGPLLKDYPTLNEAQNIISDLEALYISSLRSIRYTLKKNGIVVMVFPRIRTKDSKRVSMNVNKIIHKNFKIIESIDNIFEYTAPFIHAGKQQKIEREIYILKK